VGGQFVLAAGLVIPAVGLVILGAGPAVAQADEEAQRAAARLNREGIAHLGAKRYREAVDAFQAAREHLPKDASLRRNLATAFAYLGVVHMNAGRFGDAGRALGQAIGLDPERARIRYYRGVLDFKQTRYRESVRRLEAVLKEAPDDAEALETLGGDAVRKDQRDRAQSALSCQSRCIPAGCGAGGG